LHLVIEVYPEFIDLNFFEYGSCPGIVVPKAGRQGKLFVVFYFGYAVLDVKENLPGRGDGPS
jgi:hypothetical protein